MASDAQRAQAAPALDFGLADDSSIIALLRSGDHAQLLGAIFGPEEYTRLRQLARGIKAPPKSAPRVYILPGLMGSRLGVIDGSRKHSLWLNLQAIAAGGLAQLSLHSQPPVQVIGAMLPSYLKMKLLLGLAGFDARLHAYDWRRSVLDSATQFMAHLQAEGIKKVALIGHSMGGLVARAAMSLDKRRIGTVIQLGTPNLGSYAPMQALRAAYPSMLKLASLDAAHSPDYLAREVFRTLPGLYELLPAANASDIDVARADAWPRDALQPDTAQLAMAVAMRARLAQANRQCHHIVGVEQDTVVGIERVNDEFIYRYSKDGDGTVPRALSLWPDAHTWYAAERHGALANNERICKAVIDLLRRGETRRLRKTAPSTTGPNDAVIRRVSDSELRSRLQHKVKLERVPIEERRSILEPVISPQFAALAAQP